MLHEILTAIQLVAMRMSIAAESLRGTNVKSRVSFSTNNDKYEARCQLYMYDAGKQNVWKEFSATGTSYDMAAITLLNTLIEPFKARYDEDLELLKAVYKFLPVNKPADKPSTSPCPLDHIFNESMSKLAT